MDKGTWVYPLAALATVGVVAAAVWPSSRRTRRPPPIPPKASAPNLIAWLGGPVRENIDGLAYMFATENDDASLLVWTLQAIAANNFARQLARGHQQIKSIADMLKSGIDKSRKPYRRLYGLEWGPQYDKQKKITRFAATTRGRSPLSVAWPKFELAERLLAGRINFDELKGRRGESMPSPEEWGRINSYLQYEGFGEIVQRQAGDGAEQDPNVVVKGWGTSRLVSTVEGLRFYAVGG